MSIQGANSKTVEQIDARDSLATRQSLRRLRLARAAWLVLAPVVLGLDAVGIPVVYEQGRRICTSGPCSHLSSQLTPAGVQALQALGLSIDFFAAYQVALQIIAVLAYTAIAAVIFWRRSNDGMALLAAFTLLSFGSVAFGPLNALPDAKPIWWLPVAVVSYFGQVCFGLLFYLFPNGRFAPRWTRWLAGAVVVLWIPSIFFPNTPFALFTGASVVFLGYVTSLIAVQVYRYRRVSNSVERQQTKWVVFGLAVGLGGFIGALIFGNVLFPSLAQASGPSQMVGNTLISGFLLLIPLSIGLAILRSRLWEIDLLINRTLVYVPLTGILAGLFAASITLSQRLFIALTGQQSDAATVLTTLIVVAAFDPIKTGLQHLVDRRFKEAPDPSKKLNAFGEQVQSVVQVIDARQVTRRLLDEAILAFDATGGAVYLQDGEHERLLHRSGEWNGEASIHVSLENNGVRLGLLSLGPRRSGSEYLPEDRAALQLAADRVAQAVALAERTNFQLTSL